MRTRLRKQSKNPLPKLKAKAWKVFSAYIRKRDGYRCFTCGKKEKPGQAGHFKHGRLDFDEMNINCQCVRCNKWLHGNGIAYAMNLIDKYGESKVRELIQLANQPHKYTREELEDIIKKYS